MNYNFIIKGVTLVILLTLVSIFNDIPLLSKIVPYLIKNQYVSINKNITFGNIDFNPINGIIKIEKLNILNEQKKSELYADKVLIDLGVAALLKHQEIEISSIKIYNLRMRYVKHENGESNFSYLFKDDKKKPASTPAQPVKKSEKKSVAPEKDIFNYVIRNIEFINGTIDFYHTGQSYLLNDVYLKIYEITNNSKELDIALSGKIKTGSFNSTMKIYLTKDKLEFNCQGRGIDLTMFKKSIEKSSDLKIYAGQTNLDISGSLADDNKTLILKSAIQISNGSFDWKNNELGFRDFYINISNYNSAEKICEIDTLAAAYCYVKYFAEKNYGDSTYASDSAPAETLPKTVEKFSSIDNKILPNIKADTPVKNKNVDFVADTYIHIDTNISVKDNEETSIIDCFIKIAYAANATVALYYPYPEDTLIISFDNFISKRYSAI